MEAKLKHLEFVQAAISRMANNSFLFKGWAITIVAALSAFAAVNTRPALLIVALVSTSMFWALDGYYLWLERGFVELHVLISGKAESDIDFSMRIDKSNATRKWIKTCGRPHLLLFYLTIIVVDLVGICIIRSK
jgi:hypothetical protein